MSSSAMATGLSSLHEDPMDQLRGHSITSHIAVAPQQGRKVFTLQTLPDERDAYDAPATAVPYRGASAEAGRVRVTRESRTATGQSVQLIHRNVSVYPYVAAKC